MLSEILDYIHNHFVLSTTEGDFTVTNGELQTDKLSNRQYFWVNGSAFSDGVWQYGVDLIKYDGFNVSETFTGTVSALAIPADLLSLAGEISNYISKNGDTMNSPFQSESFGGYSYTKAQGSNGAANGADWRSVFASRLNRWRKV